MFGLHPQLKQNSFRQHNPNHIGVSLESKTWRECPSVSSFTSKLAFCFFSFDLVTTLQFPIANGSSLYQGKVDFPKGHHEGLCSGREDDQYPPVPCPEEPYRRNPGGARPMGGVIPIHWGSTKTSSWRPWISSLSFESHHKLS